jgi:hypothetical protein
MAKRPAPEATRAHLEETIATIQARKADGYLIDDYWTVVHPDPTDAYSYDAELPGRWVGGHYIRYNIAFVNTGDRGCAHGPGHRYRVSPEPGVMIPHVCMQ